MSIIKFSGFICSQDKTERATNSKIFCRSVPNLYCIHSTLGCKLNTNYVSVFQINLNKLIRSDFRVPWEVLQRGVESQFFAHLWSRVGVPTSIYGSSIPTCELPKGSLCVLLLSRSSCVELFSFDGDLFSHVCAIEVFTYQDLSIIQIGSTPCFQLKPFY